MHRCLELAQLGAGFVAPNPMVGAVLVYNDRIIGEGWHEKYGEPHAEVNCIASVKDEEQKFIRHSVLYVSLEPCVHYGKTPPCTELIIKQNIPKVVIGCRDPFEEVNGKGIEKLRAADIEVTVGLLEKECRELNKRFLTFHEKRRPWIILKWAETANSKIAANGERLFISNEFTNRIVHKWRSEEAAILIGTNTAIKDNPNLTNRLWNGKSPIRLVIDMELKLDPSLNIFDDRAPTILFNKLKHDMPADLRAGRNAVGYYRVTDDVSLVQQIINAIYQMKIQSVIVEGGAKLLQSFIDDGSWDEARVIRNENLVSNAGLNAPVLAGADLTSKQNMLTDSISIYQPANILPTPDSGLPTPDSGLPTIL